MTYEPHDFCLAFPEMTPGEFRKLSADIKANGLLHEIVLYEGKILDGRHRYKACIEHGIEPSFTQYLGVDPAGHVASENANRRHLSPSQLGMVGAKLTEVESERARVRQIANLKKGSESPSDPRGSDGGGRVSEIISEKLGIGRNTMQRAITVRKKAQPEVVKAVEDGKMTVNEATRVVVLNPAAQKKIAEIDDKQTRTTEINKAVNRSAACKRRDNPPPEVVLPGTPFVRQFLGTLETLTNRLASEFKMKDKAEIQARFADEFDRTSSQLQQQLARCAQVMSAISKIHQSVISEFTDAA